MRSRHLLCSLVLATATLASCAEPEPEPKPDTPATLRRDTARAVLQRTRLAESGRFLVPAAPKLAVTQDEGQALVDALDIPAALNPTFTSLVSPDLEAAVVRNSYGIIQPTHLDGAGHGSFLILSTGRSGDESINAPAEPGVDFPPIGPDGDVTTLQFQVNVPDGVNRMSFDYTFLSAESPDFIGSAFNDTFTATVSDSLGANRTIATASVNTAEFHPASETAVGPCPFQLYVTDPTGVNFPPFNLDGAAQPDAGTTGYQRVDVQVGKGLVTVTFDIRDLGDGILDSAVIIDNVQFSSLEVVDPHGSLINTFSGQVFHTPDARLTSSGTPIRTAVADGTTQVVLRSNVSGPGTAVFSVPSGNASDGSVSNDDAAPAWGASATTNAVLINGKWYVFALYRSAPDYNCAPGCSDPAIDIPASTRRPATLAMDFTSTLGQQVHQGASIDLVRPAVVVVPDIWSSCALWTDHGSIGDPIPTDPALENHFAVSCVDYQATSAKSFDDPANQIALADAIDQALQTQRVGATAATRVDVVGHGMGALLARRYIDAPSFVRFDNFNLGEINRLITVNAPHLGARLADEIIRTRNTMKAADAANGTQNWPSIKATALAPAGIHFDDADQDLALQEMGANSTLIAAIGASPARSSLVSYHAVLSSGGHDLTRAQAQTLLAGRVGIGMKNFFIAMEFNHPSTVGLTVPAKQSLIYGKTVPTSSIIFCNNNPVLATDQHDLFATTWEQRGGLDPAASSTVPIDTTLANSGHFSLQNDPAHAAHLLELLGQPITAGSFSSTMPASGAIARVNNCPILPPLPLVPAAPAALVAHTISITAPVDGATVTPGSKVTVTVATDGGEPPEAVLITSVASSELVEVAPFTAEVTIPSDAIGTTPVNAIAFYAQGGLAFATTVQLHVEVTTSVTALAVLNGDVVLRGPGRTRQVAVIGTYSDGVRRDVTPATSGTVYTVSQLSEIITATADGLIQAVGPGDATLTVTNGAARTSVNVHVGKLVPPVAVCASPTQCNDPGLCAANITDLGAGSFDPNGGALQLTQSPAGPYSVGAHEVEVEVTNGELDAQCVSQVAVLDCEAPSLSCPADFKAECTGAGSALVTPPSATASDNCGATTTAPPAAQLALGAHALSYTASDPSGNATSCTTTATVQDTTPPSLACPAPIVAECAHHGSAFVTPGHATASDVCTSATVTEPAAGTFPLGTTTVAYAAQDLAGNRATCDATIKVVDTRPPYVEAEHTVTLWPPDHKYRTVHLEDCGIEVNDGCGGHLAPSTYQAKLTCVSSNEPDDAHGHGDGNTRDDIVIVDDHTVKLRAERDGDGDGRRYDLRFVVHDASGNPADSVCTVVVPHDAHCARYPDAHGCRVHGHARQTVCAP